MRIGVKFQRTGKAKYLSHLDMQRVFSRALKKSGLPVKYSQGFNPHIVMSFATALSVGMETYGDYMEFSLTLQINISEVKSTLQSILSGDICVLECGRLDEKCKKLMAATHSAVYKVLPDSAFTNGIEMLKNSPSYIIKKERKGKIREIDALPLIYNISENSMQLALSGEKSLMPSLLFKSFSSDAIAVRLDILDENDKPLSDLFIKTS